MGMLNIKELHDIEIKYRYLVKISKRFATLDNLDSSAGINRAFKYIIVSINISAKESPGSYGGTQTKC
jgi:hypothetical protein